MTMDIPLAPLTIGIDNVSDDYAVPFGAVTDAVNVDIDRNGGWQRRRGRELGSAGACHSLWTASDGRSFGVRGTQLCRVTIDGTALTFTALRALDVPQAPVRYDELNGEIIACDRTTLWRIDANDVVSRLAMETPPTPALDVESSGDLYAGRYGVACAFLRGDEEGPLSTIAFADVAEGGGLTVALSGPADDSLVDAVRIYRTDANGDVLRRAVDAPVVLDSWALGAQELGRGADTQNLAPMPGGSIIREWRGRLLVASGRTLRLSQPMRFGLRDPRTDFVQFATPIRVMVGVEGGVFVGTGDGVVFLDGTLPSEWKQVRKSARLAVTGSDLRVRADLLGGDQPSDRWVAVWLAENGFVVGMPDGQLIEQQAKRIRLPDSETAAGVAAAVVHDRQIIASIN